MNVDQKTPNFLLAVFYPILLLTNSAISPICVSINSLSSTISAKYSFRISSLDAMYVSFSKSILSSINNPNTKCLNISAYSFFDALGNVPLVFSKVYRHHVTSFDDVSLFIDARSKFSTIRFLLDSYFWSNNFLIAINSWSNCVRIALYSCYSFFLLLFSSCYAYFILSISSSNTFMFSSLSRDMLFIEFFDGTTLCSLWAAEL